MLINSRTFYLRLAEKARIRIGITAELSSGPGGVSIRMSAISYICCFVRQFGPLRSMSSIIPITSFTRFRSETGSFSRKCGGSMPSMSLATETPSTPAILMTCKIPGSLYRSGPQISRIDPRDRPAISDTFDSDHSPASAIARLMFVLCVYMGRRAREKFVSCVFFLGGRIAGARRWLASPTASSGSTPPRLGW